MYYTMLNLWILSFHENAYKQFLDQDIKLIEKMIHVI